MYETYVSREFNGISKDTSLDLTIRNWASTYWLIDERYRLIVNMWSSWGLYDLEGYTHRIQDLAWETIRAQDALYS
jgi:hypothetical protein